MFTVCAVFVVLVGAVRGWVGRWCGLGRHELCGGLTVLLWMQMCTGRRYWHLCVRSCRCGVHIGVHSGGTRPDVDRKPTTSPSSRLTGRQRSKRHHRPWLRVYVAVMVVLGGVVVQAGTEDVVRLQVPESNVLVTACTCNYNLNDW